MGPESLTISFRSRASAASRLAGLVARARSTGAAPLLRSSWIMAFLACILSISLHDPPLEFSRPLRLFGSGGSPSIQAGAPLAAPFEDFPFMVHSRHRILKNNNSNITNKLPGTRSREGARGHEHNRDRITTNKTVDGTNPNLQRYNSHSPSIVYHKYVQKHFSKEIWFLLRSFQRPKVEKITT